MLSGKMVSGVERVFRPIRIHGYVGNQLHQEVHMHYIHFLNEDGTVRKSTGQRSLYGECDYTFPDGTVKRLILLGTDARGNPMIPGVM